MPIVIQPGRVKEIQLFIDANVCSPPKKILEQLQNNYVDLPQATIFSIVNQRLRGRCAAGGRKLRNWDTQGLYYTPYRL